MIPPSKHELCIIINCSQTGKNLDSVFGVSSELPWALTFGNIVLVFFLIRLFLSLKTSQFVSQSVNQPVGRSGRSLSIDSASQLIYQLIHQLSDINSFWRSTSQSIFRLVCHLLKPCISKICFYLFRQIFNILNVIFVYFILVTR